MSDGQLLYQMQLLVSNLATITESPLPNIQIESYPGARVLHMLSLLDKAEKKLNKSMYSRYLAQNAAIWLAVEVLRNDEPIHIHL